MKKTLLIILGVLLILIVGGVWAFLFIFGTPRDGEGGIFANFGFSNSDPVITDMNPSIVDTAPVDGSGALQRLRQLTTRPVAGATFIDGGIRYVERGTGHIYDIMFSTGNETAISSFTIARVVDALFASNGAYVALTTESPSGNSVYIGSLDNSEQDAALTGIYLPSGAREVAFDDDESKLYYINDVPAGISGYTYDVISEESTLLFTIPLRDARVLWGDINYVYTTPSSEQIGYLYQISNNALIKKAPGGNGLTGYLYNGGYVTSSESDSFRKTVAYEAGQEYILPLNFLPEKCVEHAVATSTLICAEGDSPIQTKLPDDWYSGKISFSDSLWEIAVPTGELVLLSDMTTESGREIDVAKIDTNETGEYIYFINKNDNSLWMFDTTF